jgi:hypothetical protein
MALTVFAHKRAGGRIIGFEGERVLEQAGVLLRQSCFHASRHTDCARFVMGIARYCCYDARADMETIG